MHKAVRPDGLYGFAAPVALLDDDNMTVVYALLGGAVPYAGGLFFLSYIFRPDTPFSPPRCRFMGVPPLHPNVSREGNIDIDVLRDLYSPAMTTEKCVVALGSLLSRDSCWACPGIHRGGYEHTASLMEGHDGDDHEAFARRFDATVREHVGRHGVVGSASGACPLDALPREVAEAGRQWLAEATRDPLSPDARLVVARLLLGYVPPGDGEVGEAT
jgi:hypothetical protein